MHFGNFSFWFDNALPFRVAPSYDMLPMLWAPGPQGELVERRFAPVPPVPAAQDAWRDAAAWADEFWRNLAADGRLSPEFAAFAGDARGLGQTAALCGWLSPHLQGRNHFDFSSLLALVYLLNS